MVEGFNTYFVNLLRLAVHEKLELSCAIGGNKRDIRLLWDNLGDLIDRLTWLRDQRVSCGAENATPILYLLAFYSLEFLDNWWDIYQLASLP